MIGVTIDEIGLENAEAFLAATPKQVDAAMVSTLTKMARWLTTKSVRELAKHLKLPQKEVRRRLRTFRLARVAGGKGVRVWYGLDPMGMIHLNARQTKQGVSAYGGRFVKGAFIANGRAGSSGPAASNRQVFVREGKTRLPIKKVTVELGDQAQTYIEDRLLAGAGFTERFFKVFEHELTWRQKR
ncbi:hypothetical protein [Burkholderia stagnalis]|uniref:hypothetical protein n=1 Tax=Burkholderia stagnalis TaxID=1503054 RepID=UPI000F56B5D4|nr:hypothetical protein [Burkholderia stagnalis]RQQ37067.1 hypothetical protein DF163_01475 [Burkholderia stagnalis]RQQ55646.1 hypothetical protein DF162_01720 [Burkholderia stagnalis]RQY19107.1 hypothetical protein DF118_01725 [Burkholderia stagnalis]RQY64208.1 hypothetical protein DF112_00485 [Burkholderia stagnalis]RQY70395.1 hypothetical protein DF109_02305 [Burkholderia stagnalis]